MRDYVLIAIFLYLLPMCFQRPYVGILTWSWLGYMNPHRLTWGIAYSFPFAQIVAITTILGMWVGKKTSWRPIERETILLFLLWGMFTFTSLFALNPEGAWEKWQITSKILLITFLTMYLINDFEKLRLLALVIALSLGYYGFKGGLFSLLSGGQFRVYGPEGSFFGDNNALALALNMILPFLFYLAKEEQNLKLKLILRVTFFFTVLAVLFTYSRGGFLGLAVVALSMFMRMSLGQKTIVAFLGIMLLPMAMPLIPEQWFDRMRTIETYESDASAMGRINAWMLAWRIAVSRPITGGGFQAMENREMYDIYYPEATHKTDVHSVYFETLGEHGFVTLGVFLALLFSAVASLRKLRKQARERPSMSWLSSYSHMVQVSLYAYLVSGAFLELLTFDFFYHLIAIIVILKTLVRQEIMAEARGDNVVV